MFAVTFPLHVSDVAFMVVEVFEEKLLALTIILQLPPAPVAHEAGLKLNLEFDCEKETAFPDCPSLRVAVRVRDGDPELKFTGFGEREILQLPGVVHGPCATQR